MTSAGKRIEPMIIKTQYEAKDAKNLQRQRMHFNKKRGQQQRKMMQRANSMSKPKTTLS